MTIKVNNEEYQVLSIHYNQFDECYYYITETKVFNDNDDEIEVVKWK